MPPHDIPITAIFDASSLPLYRLPLRLFSANAQLTASINCDDFVAGPAAACLPSPFGAPFASPFGAPPLGAAFPWAGGATGGPIAIARYPWDAISIRKLR